VFMMRFEMIDSKSGEKAQQRLAEGMTKCVSAKKY
jgi:hypothetical protein